MSLSLCRPQSHLHRTLHSSSQSVAAADAGALPPESEAQRRASEANLPGTAAQAVAHAAKEDDEEAALAAALGALISAVEAAAQEV